MNMRVKNDCPFFKWSYSALGQSHIQCIPMTHVVLEAMFEDTECIPMAFVAILCSSCVDPFVDPSVDSLQAILIPCSKTYAADGSSQTWHRSACLSLLVPT